MATFTLAHMHAKIVPPLRVCILEAINAGDSKGLGMRLAIFHIPLHHTVSNILSHIQISSGAYIASSIMCDAESDPHCILGLGMRQMRLCKMFALLSAMECFSSSPQHLLLPYKMCKCGSSGQYH